MDACPPGRYAGVARYLASLEMAGSDLETPPLDLDTSNDRPQAAAAKPEVNGGDDVTRGASASPASRRHRQVVVSTSSVTCLLISLLQSEICKKKVKVAYTRLPSVGFRS